MTIQTCKKMLEHYKSIGNAEKVKEYEERIERKQKRLGIKPEKEEKTKSKGKK